MKRNILLLSILVVVVGLGIYLFLSKRNIEKTSPPNKESSSAFENVYSPPSEQTDTTADEIKVYFIDIENKRGSTDIIGCGDSVAPITTSIAKKGKQTADLVKTALDYLFETKEQFPGKGGLYNSLYQSSLTFDRVVIDQGKASVYLKGEMALGGTCDDPRAKTQLERTVKQFSEITEVQFYLNGQLMTFSQK
jgi:hypothetical protein